MLAVATMAWTLGGCEGQTSAREARAELERWAAGRLGASAVAAGAVAAPAAYALSVPDLRASAPEGLSATENGTASTAYRAQGGLGDAPLDAPLGGDGTAASLPLAVPQPIPTPSRTSASPPFLTESELPRPSARQRALDPLARVVPLRALGGASYEATLVLTPDSGEPLHRTLLVEYGGQESNSTPSQRVRLMSIDADGGETVRLEEVQVGRYWYSYSNSTGTWDRQEVTDPPDISERLGSLAWLLHPAGLLEDVGRQDMGLDPARGEHARHYRYGRAAIRDEWLQSMDLPDLESATIDVWIDEETNALLGLEMEGRCLTYSGKITARAWTRLLAVGPEVAIQRPDVCIETALPPDVVIIPGVEAASHECNAWVYPMEGSMREVAIAHQEVLAAEGWRYVEAESYYPDYLMFRKGLRQVVVRIDAQSDPAYAILTVAAPGP